MRIKLLILGFKELRTSISVLFLSFQTWVFQTFSQITHICSEDLFYVSHFKHLERFKAALRRWPAIFIYFLCLIVFCNDTQRLFPIYTGKTVGSRFGRMLIKIQDLKFGPGIAFAVCTNQLNLPKNGRERLKPVSKTSFEEMEHGFLFGTFQPGNQDYNCTFLEVPLLPEVLHRRTQKVMFHLLANRIFRKPLIG